EGPAPPPEARAPSTWSGARGWVGQLRIVYSPEPASARMVLLDKERLVIGRDPGAAPALKLDDGHVSSAHAAIEPSADGAAWSIVDLDSRNGVYVDGARTARAALRAGAVIRIGRSLLVFVAAEVQPDARFEPETPALRGQSVAMQRVRGEIALVAVGVMPVLVLGETGVGKERVAEEIHRLSGRGGGFVPVNCAAIPPDLAESELFGHAAGAFTGATGKFDGLFAAAEGGTLFLDEVGELPAPLQPKLLRALARREVGAAGPAPARRIDVRIVAATLRALDGEVARGGFRADLLARLASWRIAIPPLRERREDILRLAQGVLE